MCVHVCACMLSVLWLRQNHIWCVYAERIVAWCVYAVALVRVC